MTALYLTDQQAARMVLSAGWRGEDAVTALAVSFGEAGDPKDPGHRINAHAVGDVALQTGVWGPSIGTMQIRSLKADKGTGRTRDEMANMDPSVCYRHAHTIWQQAGGFRPWSVWLHGTYRRFLDRAGGAVAAVVPAKFTLHRYLYWQPEMSSRAMLHGDDVRHVQTELGMTGTGPRGVDGWYGPHTEQAVQHFQRLHGLADDGIVGPITAHAMHAAWRP
jgi:murein L,D-transpeptidase YcbB/YkuD